MARLIWSPRAVGDLEAIRAFILRDSEIHARMVIERIWAIVLSVRTFPNMGRIVPEYSDPKLRERLAYQYRIVYRVREADRIEIVRIVHTSRLFK